MMMLRKSLLLVLLSSFLSAYTVNSVAAIVYASDQLTVPMRTGTTIRHKIIRFIPSGEKLELLETSDDESYSKVVTGDGKEGWVKSSNLLHEPGAYEKLEKAQQKITAQQKKIALLQDNIKQLKAERQQLAETKQGLLNKNERLMANIQELRLASSEPIKVAERNQKLEAEILAEREKNQDLKKENEFLSNQSLRDWFVIGALVSLGSLFLGLIIPRISWRRKDSWSNSF